VHTEDIRQAAIESHDRDAAKFEAWYGALDRSRFSNAFTYGRSKIDALIADLFETLPNGARVLDVGCGTGEHLARAAKQGLRPFGVEPAPAMLDFARRNVPGAGSTPKGWRPCRAARAKCSPVPQPTSRTFAPLGRVSNKSAIRASIFDRP
jgi:SAM-dependent methyltransferase